LVDCLLWTVFGKLHKYAGHLLGPQLGLCINFGKQGVGHMMVDFLTSSFGHPGLDLLVSFSPTIWALGSFWKLLKESIFGLLLPTRKSYVFTTNVLGNTLGDFLKKSSCHKLFTKKHAMAYKQQGCQMVYLQTKNFNLGKFWRALEWKIAGIIYDNLKYLTAIWYTLWPFGIYLNVIWYIFPLLVCCTMKNLATLLRRKTPANLGLPF
jgi:hypothetical protein